MKRAWITLATLCLSTALLGQIPEGDQQWAARAEGHQGGHARTNRVDAAIAAYRVAVAKEPNDLEARWKLLRAIRFKGAYVATTNDEKKAVYGQAKSEGEAALKLLDARLHAKGVPSIASAGEKQVADAARGVAGAAEIFHWDAVNWGEWALAYGKMAALHEGAADRIKRESNIANLIDPKLDGGGPTRVLGRLYNQTPHVPFITGWASNKDAIKFLNDSLKLDPKNKITRVFLAEAMVDNDSDSKPQAVQILKDVAGTPNNPDFEVEESQAQEDARGLLKKWGT